MIFGKTKISLLLNLLIIGALAVAIWFYIQQQIVGERDMEFQLEVRVHAARDAGDVIVLAREVDGAVGNDTLTIRLRGSKAELDEIFRSSNVAAITLTPKAADFDANKKFEPLKVDVAISAAHLKLPPEVKIVSAPTVSIILARRIEKTVPVTVTYSEDAQKLLVNPVKEVSVRVVGPRFILDNPEWSPVTETITKDWLPAPGRTTKVTANIETDAREYLPDLAYPVDLHFDQAGIDVELAVKEEYVEIELKDLPVRIMADGPDWVNQHRVEFHPPNVTRTLRIRIPKSEDKAKILTKDNVRIYAVFTGKHAQPGQHTDVELRIVYTGGAGWPGAWPEWAEIVSPKKDEFTVLAIVTKIETPTTTE